MSNKAYKLITTKLFRNQIKKIDSKQRNILLKKIQIDLVDSTNPRLKGSALSGKFKGLWRYRYGDFRVIVRIDDDELIILALEIGHRKDIYK